MPQGHRKTAFSGKKKKAQIQAKRQNKADTKPAFRGAPHGSDDEEAEGSSIQDRMTKARKLNIQPSRDNRSKPNRYALQFYRESEKELRELKEQARHSLNYIDLKDQEMDVDYFGDFDFPRRPTWRAGVSKDELERNENRYFTEYVNKLERNCDPKDLSYFELNLETWRQLWRVLEMSDIILIITDIRYTNLMFPPSIYDYVTKDLEKDIILVLNKIDLAPATLVLAWKKYFHEKYPSVKVVMFTSFPSYNMRGASTENQQGLQIRRRRGKLRMAAEGAMQILKLCKDIVAKEVDLSSWENKIMEEMSCDASGDADGDDEDDEVIAGETLKHDLDFQFREHAKYEKGILTIGCVGFPNVGKSSLLNAVMGKKVVSVSRTPGHTKHFQTIFLTNNVRLCDCPGLVFPSSTPRKLQVLMGSYPIAQLRDPYGSIRYLAERINLQKLLNIQHLEKDDTWSATDICDSWAIKRGFITAKAGRPDTYRAANNILRMALEGKLSLCVRPPGYLASLEALKIDPELEEVVYIQALGKTEEMGEAEVVLSSSDEETQKDEDDTREDDGSSDDEEDDRKAIPATKNVFALLNDE